MAHDKHNVTITRYEGSLNWRMAIQPDDRSWILYVGTGGIPSLYMRVEDIKDENGDTRERYVYSIDLALAHAAGERSDEPGAAAREVFVGRYSSEAHGWAFYIEPKDRSWITFVGKDNVPHTFQHRDPQTGAVLFGDTEEERSAHLATIRAEGGLRTGSFNDGSAKWPEGYSDPIRVGEPIPPIGERGDARCRAKHAPMDHAAAKLMDIRVEHYANPEATGWKGWIEPADKSWITFVGLDGRPVHFANRDPETGAVLDGDPAMHLPPLRADGGLRTPAPDDHGEGALAL